MSSSVIMVSAMKPSKKSMVGITLRNMDDGGIFISAMKPGNIFAKTLLQVGMKIDEINGIDCTESTNKIAANILREADGMVTIKAHVIEGTSQQIPPKPIIPVVTATLAISGMKEGSKAAHTVLTVNMKIDEINGIPCQDLSVTQAYNLFLLEADEGGEGEMVSFKAHHDPNAATIIQASTSQTMTRQINKGGRDILTDGLFAPLVEEGDPEAIMCCCECLVSIFSGDISGV